VKMIDATPILNALEKEEETQVQHHFARDGVKGNGNACEVSGGGRRWWLKSER